MQDAPEPISRTIDLHERLPDRRVFWGVYAFACGVGALVFLTAREDGSTPWFFAGFVAIGTAVIWFNIRIGVLSRTWFQTGRLRRLRLEPSLWRFWFAPPRGPEREPSAWVLWIASCVTAVLYFFAVARVMFLTLS